MQTAKSDRFAQPSNRRTGPVMLAALILLAIAIGFIDHLPTFAQEDTRAIGAVQLESNQPGELHVSWDPPTDTPRDYRIIWARVGEDFLSWTDSRGNAFPTSPSYTITGLDEGVRYKVRVRARYASGNAGGWTDVVEAIVASAPTATYTPTPTATNTATLVPTVTYTAAPEPTATHTATPVPTATYTDRDLHGYACTERYLHGYACADRDLHGYACTERYLHGYACADRYQHGHAFATGLLGGRRGAP